MTTTCTRDDCKYAVPLPCEDCRNGDCFEQINGDLPDSWRSVKDELPDNVDDVLVYCGPQEIYIGYYNKRSNGWRTNDGDHIYSVTHWQPLPAPPADKGEANRR